MIGFARVSGRTALRQRCRADTPRTVRCPERVATPVPGQSMSHSALLVS